MRAFLEQYGTSIFVLVLVTLLITLGPVVAKEVNGRLYNEVEDLPKATKVVADEDDPSLVHNGTIPEGGVYTATNGTVYNAGDEFPTTVEDGDEYDFGDLKYTLFVPTYSTWDEGKNALMQSLGATTEEEWQAAISARDTTEEELKELAKSDGFWGPSTWSVAAINTEIQEAKIMKNINNGAVIAIEEEAFYNCQDLTSVSIPNSILSIEMYAFKFCKSLTSVNIPNSVTTIACQAFAYCDSLQTVVVPNKVTSLFSVFLSCPNLISVSIPDTVTNISSAFDSCTSLTSIDFLSGITNIGSYAFVNCTGLQSITIPNSVNTIGESSFSRCTNLTSVTFSNSVSRINNDAFSGCTKLTSVNFIGTKAQWNDISKVSGWKGNITTIHCTDGDITL